MKRYGYSVSPCSTPATMSKYSVSPSGDRTFPIVSHNLLESICRVDYCCRINRLLRFRGVITSTNECPRYDPKQSAGDFPVMQEIWEMQRTPLLPSLPDLFWLGVVALDRAQSMVQIELKCVHMLNWIAWNKTVLTFKLRTYAKLNCLKWNCFYMLNCIVLNRTVNDIKIYLC